MNKKDDKITPSYASGMDDHDELDEKATKDEIKRGEYTEVTTLSYDEVDPS